MRIAGVILVLGLMMPGAVRAGPSDSELEDALVWALWTMELGGAGVVWAKTHGFDHQDWREAALITAPIVAGVGVGLASHLGDWSPSVPLAVHGASWMGLDLFLLGGLLSGDDDDGFHAGAMAWSLAAIGAAAGGYLGATEVDPGIERQLWMGMQYGGIVGAFGGVLAVFIAQDFDHATETRVVGWSALVGLTLGLGAGAALAFTRDEDATSTYVEVSTPMLSPAPHGLVLGWGGRF